MNRMNMILYNTWEKYDAERMRKKKRAFIFAVMLILWIFLTFSFSIFLDITTSTIIATVQTIIVIIIFVIKVRQIDIEKDGWYFSILQDKRLNRNEVLALLREILKSEGYPFYEEENHRTIKLHISYFNIPTTDFRVRLWYTRINGVPIAEIGIGPENTLNREILKELRDKISDEFSKRYRTYEK